MNSQTAKVQRLKVYHMSIHLMVILQKAKRRKITMNEKTLSPEQMEKVLNLALLKACQALDAANDGYGMVKTNYFNQFVKESREELGL
jgi:hypothetical protein